MVLSNESDPNPYRAPEALDRGPGERGRLGGAGEILKKFRKILVPELNSGQLSWLLRAKYLVPAEGLNKVQGKPFLVSEIEEAIEKMLK